MDPTLLDRALLLAARAHEGQTRKGTDIPYLLHPVHVAMTLIRHAFPEHVVLAGVLHDVIEDGDVTREQLAVEFGEEVAELVVAVSKPADKGVSWRDAKHHMLAALAAHGEHAAAVKCADALHNAFSTLRDVREQGPKVWDRFNASAADICWYYGAIVEACRPLLGGHPLHDELASMVTDLATEVQR